MRAYIPIAVAFVALAGAARADTPPADTANPAPGSGIPHSVWQLDDLGNATHLQSQWQCPASFGDYKRHDLHTYDGYGLDVSCDYADGNGDITLYLTKRSGGDLNADFEGAKKALVQRFQDATPAAESEPATFASDRSWLQQIYTDHGGAARDGVWYAWAGDWEFEIRATYLASRAADTLAMLKQMTDAARPATDHLARCAKSTVPSRDGVPATDDVPGAMFLAYATSAIAQTLPDASAKVAPDPAKLPVEWCAEDGVRGAEAPVLLWHGLNTAGQTVEADRASLMTMGDPIILESRADPELNTIEAELKRTDLPIYAVTVASGDDLDVLGFFAHRPGGATLAQFMADIAHNHLHIAGKYNLKTKQITVVTSEKK